jgi:4-hydroxy-tetrahydrodipicolinate synthase
MINQDITNIADRYYVAILLPMTEALRIDESAYRRFIQCFLREPRFLKTGGSCVNPEAGEIFYPTREEKRRVLEIAMVDRTNLPDAVET